MRILFASLVAMAAVAVATPSFAQEAATAMPTPTAKPAKARPGTTAYCNTLKSETSKTACLKRLHAAAAAKSHKMAKKTVSKGPKAAQLTPPPATAAPVAPSSGPGQISVPPLPQKTI
ncbi:MAG TPA: hypothetical protein VG433_11630 [Pirellulales bacterium]|jgi:hypothetical protein|nr:hypothetical protein [Pirellulales bacterium]